MIRCVLLGRDPTKTSKIGRNRIGKHFPGLSEMSTEHGDWKALDV